jgi:hypothetical protein
MANGTGPNQDDEVSGDQPPAEPAQVQVWSWTGETLAPFAYRWPTAERRLQPFLSEHGFALEFHAGIEHYPLVTVYSHGQDEATLSLPQQYLVVVHFASHYELILVDQLAALLEVLRYLDPVIHR